MSLNNRSHFVLADGVSDLFTQYKQYLLHPKIRLNAGELDKAIEQFRKEMLALVAKQNDGDLK